MSWWQEAIRGLFAVPTGGLSEVLGRKNQFGRTVSGGAEGGLSGFLTGGPLGAVMGAGTGAGLSGTGTTDPYSLKGGLINFGSGAGAGGLGRTGAFFAGGSPVSGASEMLPYMPTSTPSMEMAGSTLGGGIGSPLNLGMDDVSTGGAGSAGPMSQFFANVKKINQIRNLSNMMSGGQQNLQQQEAQQRQNAAQRTQELYKMFPGLLPGGSPQQHGRINFGG